MKRFLFLTIFLSASVFAGLTPEATEQWKKRDNQENLTKAVQLIEALPQDLETLSYLTRGYFLLSDTYTKKDDEKLKLFSKAREFGEKAMETNPEYKKMKDDDIKKAINALTLREIDALYWSAASLGKWAKANGIMSSLKYKDQILTMIRKVESLKPDYFYGAVDRYWGGFYAIAPGIAGGDMKKSKEHFKKAMKMAPENLGTKVFYAEVYLTKEDEEKEFTQVLTDVLSQPLGPEEIAPENAMEKRKAQDLLNRKKDLF